ncbi:MAG: nucleotidyltransferase domain-containing protein [Sulfuricellaceae bacterium]|nr:nucleotidyltransferase domain-containing protein [Sulfuricellaceae bacterium]
MKPSEALQLHRNDIRRIVEQNDARNPRVFGSTVHGDDTESSDLDLLVDPVDGKTTLISLARIQLEIESLTGVQVDIATPMALHERYRKQVLMDAVPV